MFPTTGNMDMGDPHPNPVATPVAPDPRAAAKQKMISDALRTGATQAPQGSMVGGHFVPPSPFQQANQIASGAAYGYLNQ